MRVAFACLFAASGAAALIYEVTWTRLLSLELGHGVAAASTVLAAFMGGLAVGAAVGGRYAARLTPTRALLLYAGLELSIAALALLLPYELAAVHPLFGRVYADGAGGAPFAALRLVTSLVVLSLPAAAMGATFPVASRYFVQHATQAAKDAGALYAANTVGAAMGALLAGFVLLPALGLNGTTWFAVALNALAAAGAWQVARLSAPGDAPTTPETTVAPSGIPTPTSQRRSTQSKKRGEPRSTTEPAIARMDNDGAVSGRALASFALAASGFASLSLQVVWTRLLAMMLGPTTYAFSTIVSVFIAGIAVGAAVGSRLAARSRQPLAGLALCLALSVGLAAAAALLIDRGLLAVATLVAEPGVTFGRVVLRQALLVVGLLAPMTVAFGAAFPFAVAAASRDDSRIASDLGAVYAWNTAGAIAGALLAGFVLIPLFGLHGTLRVVTVTGAVAALTVVMLNQVSGRLRSLAGAVAVAVFLFGIFLPQWNRLLLSSGAYKYAAVMQGPDLETVLTAGELLYYREGTSGTVAVRKSGGTTSLAIDGKVDASNAGDMLTQRLLAHVPLLLHPNPRQVAILGLGSGVTLGSALTHPVIRADVLEISPQVVEASRFFAAENHAALDDPRTRLLIGDGRTHLLLTEQRYDVIVSEPSNPWMAGIASLFTQEFFEAAKDRLAPGGILCQWAHTYDISTRDLQSIAATFTAVFPHGAVWLVGDGDVLFIGSDGPLDARLLQLPAHWQRSGVAADLASVGVTHPTHLLGMFVAGGERLRAWAADAPVQRDDRSALEFSGPQSIFGASAADNASLLRQMMNVPGARPAAVEQAVASATPAMERDRGWMLYQADAFRPAYEAFTRAVERDPGDQRALEGLVRVSAPLGRGAETRSLLARVAADSGQPAARLALSRLLAAEGRYDEAAAAAFAVVQGNTSNAAALEQLASILSDAGDLDRMKPVVARLRAVAPSSAGTHYYSAALLFMENRIDLAAGEARRVLAIEPNHAKAQNLLGASLASGGQRDEAREAFRASLDADPRDPATYTNLATLELEAGNSPLAARLFAEALSLDPSHQGAREGLAKVHPM